jgi:hypothetical protein
MGMRIKGLFLCCCIFSLSVLSAQEIRLRLVVSDTDIGMQDFLKVRYQLEGVGEKPDFPNSLFPDFTVLEGPEVESGYTEDASVKRYMGVSWLLKPNRKGRLLVPAMTVQYHGAIHTSNAQVVTVRPPEVDVSTDISLLIKPGESLTERVKKDVFVRLTVDKASCFVGEPVVATYLLYTRLRSESRIVKRASFNGFGVYDMDLPESGQTRMETIDGKRYTVYVLRKVQLYPLQPGERMLDPMEVEHEVTFIREDKVGGPIGLNNALRKLADGAPDDAVVRHIQTTTHAPEMIVVKPLPADSEGTFSGAVGSFSMQVHLAEKPPYRAQDQLNLVVRISGKGNFPVLPPPQIRWPEGMETFEPVVKEQYLRFISPISGTKIFTFPFVCPKAGTYVLPVLRLRYFDPEARSYKNLESNAIQMMVENARIVDTPDRSANGIQEETKQPKQPVGWWLLIISSVITFLVIVLRKRKVVLAEVEQRPVTESLAPNQPSIKLSIEGCLEAGDDREVYRRLEAEIQKWLAHRLGEGEMDNWSQALCQLGMAEEKVERLVAIRERASRALYSPWSGRDTVQEDVRMVAQLLGE